MAIVMLQTHLGAMLRRNKKVQGRAHMTKKQYVTVQTVVAANLKLVNNSGAVAATKVTPLGRPLPPPPSRAKLAAAGADALASLKTANAR
jgi:hypothetical protein